MQLATGVAIADQQHADLGTSKRSALQNTIGYFLCFRRL